MNPFRLVGAELLPGVGPLVRLSFEADGRRIETTYSVELSGIRMRLREFRGFTPRLEVLDLGPKVELNFRHYDSRFALPPEPICFCGPAPEET